MQPGPQRAMSPGQSRRLIESRHIDHEGGAADDPAGMPLDDGPVDPGGQAEIVGIDDQIFHRFFLLTAQMISSTPIQKNMRILRTMASVTPAAPPSPRAAVTNPVPVSSTPTRTGTKIKAILIARLTDSSMRAVAKVRSRPIIRRVA